MCCLLKMFLLIRKEEHVLSAEEVYVNKKGGKYVLSTEGFMLIRKEEHVLSAEEVYVNKKGGNMCCLLKRFMLIRKEGTCVVC